MCSQKKSKSSSRMGLQTCTGTRGICTRPGCVTAFRRASALKLGGCAMARASSSLSDDSSTCCTNAFGSRIITGGWKFPAISSASWWSRRLLFRNTPHTEWRLLSASRSNCARWCAHKSRNARPVRQQCADLKIRSQHTTSAWPRCMSNSRLRMSSHHKKRVRTGETLRRTHAHQRHPDSGILPYYWRAA